MSAPVTPRPFSPTYEQDLNACYKQQCAYLAKKDSNLPFTIEQLKRTFEQVEELCKKHFSSLSYYSLSAGRVHLFNRRDKSSIALLKLFSGHLFQTHSKTIYCCLKLSHLYKLTDRVISPKLIYMICLNPRDENELKGLKLAEQHGIGPKTTYAQMTFHSQYSAIYFQRAYDTSLFECLIQHADRLRAKGQRISFHESILVMGDYIRQIIEELRKIHRAELAHGDLKAENILIRGQKATFCDFSSLGPAHRKGCDEGTRARLPPEFFDSVKRNQMHDGRTWDVWALGLQLYATLNSAHELLWICFKTNSDEQISKWLVNVARNQSEIEKWEMRIFQIAAKSCGPQLGRLIQKMCSIDPLKRPTMEYVAEEYLKIYDSVKNMQIARDIVEDCLASAFATIN